MTEIDASQFAIRLRFSVPVMATCGFVTLALAVAHAQGADALGAMAEQAPERAIISRLDIGRGPAVTAISLDYAISRYPSLCEIADPDSVRDIRIDAGGFDDSDAAALARFKHLAGLILPGSSLVHCNPNVAPLSGLTDAGMKSISRCGSLKVLALGSNAITDAGVAALGQLPSLIMLELHASNVTDTGVASLIGIGSLRSAFLCLPRMTDAGLAALGSLPKLSQLNVARTSATGTGFRDFRDNCALREVGANFSDDGLRELSRLHGPIRSVDIVGPRATRAGLAHLDALPNLSRVGIFQTSLTASEIESWRRQRRGPIRIIENRDDLLREFDKDLSPLTPMPAAERTNGRSSRWGIQRQRSN